MGGIFTKEVKLDISPTTLNSTSLDDKNWLNVNAETILNNDSFTNEKYFMLVQSNDIPNPLSVSIPGHSNNNRRNEYFDLSRIPISNYSGMINGRSFMNEEESKEAHYKRCHFNLNISYDRIHKVRSLISIIISGVANSESELHKLATDALIKELSLFYDSRMEYFDNILQKRLSILKRIHIAIHREHARNRLIEMSGESLPEPFIEKQSFSNVVSISVRLILSTIKSLQRLNPDVAEDALLTLNSILQELPPYSLSSEPSDCVDSFRSWIKWTFETSCSMKSRMLALESLVGLSIARGSLLDILTSCEFLLLPFSSDNKRNEIKQAKKDADERNEDDQQSIESLYVSTFLKKMNDWNIELHLSAINHASLCGCWTINWTDTITDSNSLSFLTDQHKIASIATDGAFLYIHDTSGLVKIGSSFGGTIQGKVYARVPDFYPFEKGWLICVHNKLYYRSPSITPAMFLVIDSDDLQVLGTIYRDGKGSISSYNNSDILFGYEMEKDESSSNQKFNNNGSLWNSTDHYCTVGKRSPTFTDGRYIYILSHLNFLEFRSNKFVVDIFDPLNGMIHFKRIELHYKESDMTSYVSSVLSPNNMEYSSYYTNGQYLMVVVPPPFVTDYGYDSKMCLTRCFKLSTGELVSNQLTEWDRSYDVFCAQYDFINNVIWCYANSEFMFYANAGIAPKFTYHSSGDDEEKAIIASRLPEDGASIPPIEVVDILLGIISRLARDSMPSSSEINTLREKNSFSPYKTVIENKYQKEGYLSKQKKHLLKEPFCVDVDSQVFKILLKIMEHSRQQYYIDDTDKQTIHLNIIISCLRILKVNIHRLVSNHLNPADVGIQSLPIGLEYIDHDDESSEISSSGNLLLDIRNMLRHFISMVPSNDDIPGSKYLKEIQLEACDTLTVGLEVFYPTYYEQSLLLLKLLNESDNNIVGAKMFLKPFFRLLSNHKNPSFLVLPPSADEIKYLYFSRKDIEMLNSIKNIESFDTLHLFIPIISRLLKEAQNALHKKGQISLIQTVLNAIQKDLLLRAEKSEYTEDPDQPKRALVIYIKLVISQILELFRGIIQVVPQNDTDVTVIETMIEDIRRSVAGTLLPTLIHSLFLFSCNYWLARHILPSIIELIAILDHVNQLFPDKCKNALSLESLTSKNEFVEGPSRVSETQHPYPKGMDTLHVITIEGAIFLTLIFDDNCCTASGDYLQLYDDTSKLRPIGEKYSGDSSMWPKRRIFIPGDTVVFNFKSLGSQSRPTSLNLSSGSSNSNLLLSMSDNNISSPRRNYFGYRCVIIGNMPNNKKSSPWSVQLEKTLCCLGGQLSGSLISGEPLSPIELQHQSKIDQYMIASGLTEKGLNIYFTSKDLYESREKSKRKDRKARKKDSSIIRKQSMDDLNFDYFDGDSSRVDDEREFCESFIDMKNFGCVLANWVHSEYKSQYRNINSMKRAERSALAAILYHCSFVEDARYFTLSLIKKSSEDQKYSETRLRKAKQRIMKCCEYIILISREIIRKHQQLVSNEIEREKYHNNYNIDSRNFESSSSYLNIANNIISKARFLLYLRRSNRINKETRFNELPNAIIKFLLDDITLNDVLHIISRRRIRANNRAFGLESMNSIIQSTSYDATRYEALYFLGPSLKNSACAKRQWPHHYLDHTQSCEPSLRRKLSMSFKNLIRTLLKILQEQYSNHHLCLLILDSIVLNYTKEDHGFLHDVEMFQVLYQLMIRTNVNTSLVNNYIGLNELTIDRTIENVHKVCENVFKLLAVTCMGEYPKNDHKAVDDKFTEGSRLLYDSFFNLVAKQLDFAIDNLKEYNSILFYNNKDLLDVLSLIYTLSSSPYVKQQLSTDRFINIFFSLLQIQGDSKLRSIVLKLFKRILIFESLPERVLSEKNLSLVNFLFSVIGTIYCWTIEEINIQTIDSNVKNLLSSIYQNNIPLATSNRKLFSKSLTGKLSLSHPFFPFFDTNIKLPVGWELDQQQSQSLKLSIDFRTVTLVGLPNDIDQPEGDANASSQSNDFFSSEEIGMENAMNDSDQEQLGLSDQSVSIDLPSNDEEHIPYVVVKADNPIPDNVPLFYFEIRIDDVGSDGQGNIAIGLYPTNQRLYGLPGWHNGSLGYHSIDGRKYRSYTEGAGIPYSKTFTKNDIVGCGYCKKTGKVFFTKNGEFLGIAFKNIKGSFFPVVGMSSIGTSVTVNFGQMPFRYDPTPMVIDLKDGLRIHDHTEGYQAFTMSREIVSLLRALVKQKTLKIAIISYIVDSLNLLPDFVSKLSEGKETYSELIRIFSALLFMGGEYEDFRVGCKVEVKRRSGVSLRGTIIEYEPGMSHATVVIDSMKKTMQKNYDKIDNVMPSVHHLSELRTINGHNEIDDEIYKIIFPKVIRSVSIFLKGSPDQKFKKQLLYCRVKSLLFKVISLALKIEDVVVQFVNSEFLPLIIDLAIHSTRDSSNLDSHHMSGYEHLQRYETLSYMIMQKQFETNAPLILKRFNNDINDEEYFKSEYSNQEYHRSSMDNEGNDNVSMNDSIPSNSTQYELDNHFVTHYGRYLRWNDIHIGMHLMVLRKERKKFKNSQYYVSDWVEEMENTVGNIGLVVYLDHKTQQVLLRFIDPLSGRWDEWWYSYRVLIQPNSPPPFISDIEYFVSLYPKKIHLEKLNSIFTPLTSSTNISSSSGLSNQNNVSSSIQQSTLTSTISKLKLQTMNNNLIDTQSQTQSTSSQTNSGPQNIQQQTSNLTSMRNALYTLSIQVEQKKSSYLSQMMLLNLFMTFPLESNTLSIKSFGGPSHLVFILKLATSFFHYNNVHFKMNNSVEEIYQKSREIMYNQSTSSFIPSKQLSFVLDRVKRVLEIDSKLESILPYNPFNRKERTIHKGFLTKQGKMFKQRKKYWYVLVETDLYYFKLNQGHKSRSLGVINLRDIVSIEIEKKRKDNEFVIITHNKTYIFQASSSEERDLWVLLLNRQVQYCRIHQLHPLTDSLVIAFANECLVHLKESLTHESNSLSKQSIVVREQYLYPYAKNRIRKMVRVHNAKHLLVVFDTQCNIRSGVNILRLYRNASCTDLIESFSGKGLLIFHPLIIYNTDKFWYEFVCESEILGGEKEEEWGFSFHVTEYHTYPYPYSIVTKYSLDFGILLVEWLLGLELPYIKHIGNTMINIFEYLVTHVGQKSLSLDRRTRILNSLARLLMRFNELGGNLNESINLEILNDLESEMFTLYSLEKKIGGENSVLLQKLFFLFIQVQKFSNLLFQQELYYDISSSPYYVNDIGSDSYESDSAEYKESVQPIPKLKDEDKKRKYDEETKKKKRQDEDDKKKRQDKDEDDKKRKIEEEKRRKHEKEEDERKRRLEEERKKKLERDRKKREKKKEKKLEDDRQWFDQAYQCVNIVERLARGENFSPEFISDSILYARHLAIVEESPHPYPHGVRVTSRVHCPNAIQLRVSFDSRSRTELNCDYLMFSRDNVGGDDLGFFSGHFPTEEVIINGDNFVWSFLSDSSGEGNYWGFRFTVSPVYSDEYKEEIKEQCEEEYRVNRKYDFGWNIYSDAQFVKWINSNCERLKISSQDITFNKCSLDEIDLYPKLIGFHPSALKRRLFVMKYFNNLITKIIPLVDFSDTELWNLSKLLSSIKHLIFYDTKLSILNNCLTATNSFLRRPIAVLNRRLNPSTKANSLFIQGFNHLHFIDYVRLRQPDRAWEVRFENEGANDAGGPYRESLTQFCQDIHKPSLKLLIQSPNQVNKVGFFQDKFLPNPTAISEDALLQFEFIGKLMGIAIRTKQILDLNFPSIIWKQLVEAKLDRNDLEAIDLHFCQYLESIENYAPDENESYPFFEHCDEVFAIPTSQGDMIELKKNGKNIKVTLENRNEFIELAEQFRLSEYQLQTDAIKRGLYTIVPVHLLRIFSWKELELRVCGRPGIDLNLLKKNTIYHPDLPESLIDDFWDVLESFSQEEQTLFLRFVWGRCRLPTASEFTMKFQIHPLIKNNESISSDDNSDINIDDLYLPQAQTCFFTLNLPNYSSASVLRSKMLYAITTCREIDTDF